MSEADKETMEHMSAAPRQGYRLPQFGMSLFLGALLQERVIALLPRSGGGCLIGSSGLILQGLRLPRDG
jgi:hypothetical protein